MKKLSLKKQEELYDQVLEFYDLAEDLLDTVEQKGVEAQKKQAELVIPVVETVQESADQIAESYLSMVKNKGKSSLKDSKKVEAGLRKIFASVLEFVEKVQVLPEKEGEGQEVSLEHYEDSVAYGLVEDPSILWVGPYGKTQRNLMKSHSQFQQIIRGVLNIGNHAELLTRAFLNPVIGLVVNPSHVEPGYQQTLSARRSVPRRFSDMVGLTSSSDGVSAIR